MKTLIIGASGGFGGAVARELIARGHETTALVRPGGRDPRIEGLWQVTGDALDRAAVRGAAQGMEVIVFGLNVPYPQWRAKAAPALEIVAAVAEEIGATVIFPGNVYGLSGPFDRALDEDASREAPTELGRIRNEMEARLGSATERGARVIVLRAGDYFGAGASNTWFEHIVRKALDGGALIDPAPRSVPHAWAYLPDVARAAVRLAERRLELERYAEYHFGGHALTSVELLRAVSQVLGGSKTRRFPWWALRLVAPFWPLGRALRSMRYLWDEPVLLDDSKLRRELGFDEPLVTPLDEAVAAALRSEVLLEKRDRARGPVGVEGVTRVAHQ